VSRRSSDLRAPLPPGPGERTHVRDIFARIARRYDLVNRLMTLGRDRRWRELAVRLAKPIPGGRALDVGAGSGDLSFILAREMPRGVVVGIDFTPEIIAVCRRRAEREDPNRRLRLVEADALHLPFADESFDIVVSGFVVRNVADIGVAFAEMRRVTKPGGRVVCLEASRSDSRLVRLAHRLVIRHLLTVLGGLLTGSLRGYSYLHSTLLAFHSREELASIMRQAGWTVESIHPLCFGAVAIHVAMKRSETTM
jgi:demethylmenaquinone methyltransferase/2-methoxy-6-polyprenyl-1,4-benzoquinol methylase